MQASRNMYQRLTTKKLQPQETQIIEPPKRCEEL